MSKPGIAQLLIDSALQPDLCRRLAEAPEGVFEAYELTWLERELLRKPDHRLLPLLGAALQTAQTKTATPSVPTEAAAPAESSAAATDHAASTLETEPALIENSVLPDAQMALTIVPCLIGKRVAFAAWMAPMQDGDDPSRLPLPAGSSLPGQPLTPLYAVIQVTGALTKDAQGKAEVSLWTSFKQHTNSVMPQPPETAGVPEAAPFGSAIDSPEVQQLADAVRAAAPEERYQRLIALTRALRGGDVR
ncbi:MAG TPA: hypothetical protein VHW24_15950 [Bryobacteraceae bacterium]|nr:hypothetical protein [Bryobacteraceae bacterium]